MGVNNLKNFCFTVSHPGQVANIGIAEFYDGILENAADKIMVSRDVSI